MEHRNFEFPYKRIQLLDRIKGNRTKHIEQYEEAWKGYLIEVAEQLDKVVKDARAEGKIWKEFEGEVGKVPENINLHFHVQALPPQNHKEEYDRVIDMLDSTHEEDIILDQHEFNQYARDEWSWSRAFNETAGTYSAKFRASNA